MTRTPRPKKVRPAEDYNSLKDADLLGTSRAVENGMDGNINFPAPPVDIKTLKADNDTLAALISAAKDGSKKAIAQKNKQREVVTQDLRLNGRYVERIANGDVAIFNTSGFVLASGTRTPEVPLSPQIRSLKHGAVSGQLVIRMKSVPGAASYELRYAPVTSGTPGTWTTLPITVLKTPQTISGLTPGTMYAFQARALNKMGYSDWDDSVTMMCT